MGTQSSCDSAAVSGYLVPLSAAHRSRCSCCMREDRGKTLLPVSKKDGWKGGGWERWRTRCQMRHQAPFYSSSCPSLVQCWSWSLTHSFSHSPSRLCKRICGSQRPLVSMFSHSLHPLLTRNSHSYAISLQCLSMRPFIFPCLPLSFSLSLSPRANTHTHPHTHSDSQVHVLPLFL